MDKSKFEKSKKDVEKPRFGKEGSRKEEAFDKRQAKMPPFAKGPAAFAKGGAVKKGSRGC